MEYNGVLGEEIEKKSPSPNVVVEGEKEMREMEEVEEGRRRRVMLKF